MDRAAAQKWFTRRSFVPKCSRNPLQPNKAVGADTDGRYALTEGTVPPHHGAPEHIHHREDEAFYILEGEFEIDCGGEVHSRSCRRVCHTDSRTCLTNRARFSSVQSPSGIEGFFEHMSPAGRSGAT
ncbi:MAG: hypothetical protein DMG70_21975 [Acidobacteria bacterium]|nr:MAG: hypothetical protein DMG70_21975 [Acidobacteriota bacterium]PYY08639.1 MAG: hypothetical protein DMG69_14115 [Acidobacteriota bacterium]